MTEQEAIELLGSFYEMDEMYDAAQTAIKALEEIQQYREIGTVDECRAAVEKQTERKISSAWCPCCGKYLTSQKLEDVYYCVYCGQKLDLSDEERD